MTTQLKEWPTYCPPSVASTEIENFFDVCQTQRQPWDRTKEDVFHFIFLVFHKSIGPGWIKNKKIKDN